MRIPPSARRRGRIKEASPGRIISCAWSERIRLANETEIRFSYPSKQTSTTRRQGEGQGSISRSCFPQRCLVSGSHSRTRRVNFETRSRQSVGRHRRCSVQYARKRSPPFHTNRYSIDVEESVQLPPRDEEDSRQSSVGTRQHRNSSPVECCSISTPAQHPRESCTAQIMVGSALRLWPTVRRLRSTTSSYRSSETLYYSRAIDGSSYPRPSDSDEGIDTSTEISPSI